MARFVVGVLLVCFFVVCACSPVEEEGHDATTTGDETITADEEGDGTVNPDETNDEGSEQGGPDVDFQQCTPGETAECYHGPSGSKERGICKAGISTCASSGYWGPCEGEVLPQPEICYNGIDENCDGEDGTTDNTLDYDGDGYTYCTGDCCEFTSECLHPELVNPSAYDFPGNAVDDNCDGTVDEVITCDSGLSKDSTDPIDMAKAIGICPPVKGQDYGLVSAEILFPDGTTQSQPFQVQSQDANGNPVTIDCPAVPPRPESYAILTKFGNVIKPHEGTAFFMMATGIADDPIPPQEATPDGLPTEFMCTRSNAPTDWYQANGSKFPSSPSCSGLSGGEPGTEPVNDPVMLKVKVKVPRNARSFSVDIYFFSREFPEWVCQYNDFFVALLDSTFSSNDPNLQNPPDKNLAKDEKGNPVGINLAKAGLFRVCCNAGLIACGYDPMNNYAQFCTLGPDELAGTGLYDNNDKNGATGWLVTRGNVVPGEEITLRFAIWDTKDNILDSEVILDNFQWYPVEVKPGTGIQE